MKKILGWVMISVLLPMLAYSGSEKVNESYEYGKPGWEPDWVNNVPTSSKGYYFVGTGNGRSKANAKKIAKQDALGQVILMVNASISSDSTFSSQYEESSEAEADSAFAGGYRKIKVRGRSAIKRFKIVKTRFEKGANNTFDCYLLAIIPKKAVNKSMKDMENLRATMAKTPTVVVAVTINPYSKETYQNEQLQDYLEQFYKDQGYNIISADVDVGKLKGKSPRRHISKIKKMLGKKAKNLIYVSITPKRVRRETTGSFSYYVVEGNLSLREISLKGKKVNSVQNFSNKGISKYSLAKAFSELEKNLIADLLGGGEEEEGGYLDY
ncbi:MAG TPA: hypothetical protein ENI73_05435 [Spirochaetes bacterium]|nr:hypothetical protein [Spirochaetota bacterium]